MDKRTMDIFKRTQAAVDLRTEIALKALWEAMPWGMKITLPGGEEATLEKFVEPQRGEDGVWKFGFDVQDTAAGWHLEFFVTKTGWGGSPIGPIDLLPIPSR